MERSAQQRTRCLAALCLMVLAALSVSCRAPRPQPESLVNTPETFSSSGAELLPAQWWQSFNDPQLSMLIERALTNNFSLRSVWDRLAQAEATARKAGAPLWPSVSGTFDARRTRSEVDGRTPKETVYSSDLALGVVASYELDLWGRVRSGRDAAVLDLLASREQLQAAAITLSAQVAGVWYALVEQRGQVEVLARQQQVNQDVLEVITARFRSGQAGAADVLRQQQLVESNRGNLSTAQAAVALREHQLAILLGQPPKAAVAPIVSALPEPGPLPQTGVPSTLVQNRPDIRQAYFQVLAADQRAAVAVADRFPRITLSAGADTSGADWDELFNNWAATLAAGVVAPLFDGGTRSAEVERTRAVVSESVNNYSQSVLGALGEVEDALESERHQRDYLASLDQQLMLSRRTIERIKDGYLNGAVNYLDVLQALVSQQALERAQLQARRDLLLYRVDLCRALASGWELARPEPATLEEAKSHERTESVP